MNPQPKHKPLRNRALLDLAHGMHECTIDIPFVCEGFSLDGLEPAHGPKSMLNGGGAMKSSDIFAASCHSCHVELDQGKRLDREARMFYWMRGAARTWQELMLAGKLKVVS